MNTDSIMDDLQQDVGEWGDQTFGDVDVVTLKTRLRQELDELDVALAVGHNLRTDDVEQEAADVAIFLLLLAHKLGFSLAWAIVRKMVVNRMRIWPRDRSRPDVVPAKILGSDPT